MTKIELCESLFPRNDSMNSVSTSLLVLLVQNKRRTYPSSHKLFAGPIQNTGYSGCRNQCHVSVLQRVVSLRAQQEYAHLRHLKFILWKSPPCFV